MKALKEYKHLSTSLTNGRTYSSEMRTEVGLLGDASQPLNICIYPIIATHLPKSLNL